MAAKDCQKNSLSRQRTVLDQIALDIAEALYSFLETVANSPVGYEGCFL